MASAFLLGNLRDEQAGGHRPRDRARFDPRRRRRHSRRADGQPVRLHPLRFVVSWIAGYALRERSQQAEAAEMRATLAEHEREAAEMRAILAEREREAAARIAVAEERARIARELHDIVAHAMSVMVLQVGAVRHKLPPALEEDTEALATRRACRPHGAGRDATPARCDAQRRRQPRALAAARSRRSGLAPRPGRSRRAAGAAPRRRRASFPCRGRSTSRRTGSFRRA